jgi:CubicO group peptidase (beta-lactamase class C family)
MNKSSDIISSFLESEITTGSVPGAQYLVGEDLRIIAEDALGLAVADPERIAATLDTIYDCASLTKPLVTALLVVKFAEQGVLDLHAPISRYLSEFDNHNLREITLTELLTHTSGLPNWRPLYLEAQTRADVPAAIARILLEPQPLQPAREVIYSDLNYILLGFALERETGERLDRLGAREIFEPLQLERTMFIPPPDLLRQIAATEHGQQFEFANALADAKLRNWGDAAKFATEYNHSIASQTHWRKDVIWGEVHDGNASFMGGVAGHAGLFSTAREAFRMANQFLPGSELLTPESLKLFTENLTPGCATSRSIAWILAETPDCSAGPALPPMAFGHNGFTGTSIWMDARRRRVFVLLTNRVHPRVGATDMRQIRRRFNALAVETLDGDRAT